MPFLTNAQFRAVQEINRLTVTLRFPLFFLQNGPILTFRLNSHILKIEILSLVNF